MEQTLLGLATMIVTLASQPAELSASAMMVVQQDQVLAGHNLDLTKRLPTEFGARVFADNILLSLHYLKGDALEMGQKGQAGQMGQMDFEKVEKPFTVEFTLKPNEVFAFHDNVLPELNPSAGGPKITMHSKFFMDEGYKELGGLGGNGVCHLASLMNWVAKDAGLEVVAKVNHDFYPVPGVPRENGTAILSQSPDQNLYLKNTKDYPVSFEFKADANNVELKVVKKT